MFFKVGLSLLFSINCETFYFAGNGRRGVVDVQGNNILNRCDQSSQTN